MTTEVRALNALGRRLESRAETIIQRLAALCQSQCVASTELRGKFSDALSGIERVRIGELGPQRGSFFVEEGTLWISEEPLAKLLEFVTQDVRERQTQDEDEPFLDLFELFDEVLAGYICHELRHRSQGVEDYNLVAGIRSAGGKLAMAEIDMLADRDAAFALAAMRAEAGSRVEFLAAFEAALFLSTAYYFRVFPPSVSRHDKVARALALLFMLSRLAAASAAERFVEDERMPLDAPLIVHLKADYSTLTIYRGEPYRQLLAHCNDAVELQCLVEEVEQGSFDRAIGRCSTFLRRFNVIRRKANRDRG